MKRTFALLACLVVFIPVFSQSNNHSDSILVKRIETFLLDKTKNRSFNPHLIFVPEYDSNFVLQYAKIRIAGRTTRKMMKDIDELMEGLEIVGYNPFGKMIAYTVTGDSLDFPFSILIAPQTISQILPNKFYFINHVSSYDIVRMKKGKIKLSDFYFTVPAITKHIL